jgi:hypothetical protein
LKAIKEEKHIISCRQGGQEHGGDMIPQDRDEREIKGLRGAKAKNNIIFIITKVHLPYFMQKGIST